MTGDSRPWSSCQRYFLLARAGKCCVDDQVMVRIQPGDLFEAEIRRSILGFAIENTDLSVWWRCPYVQGTPLLDRCVEIKL